MREVVKYVSGCNAVGFMYVTLSRKLLPGEKEWIRLGVEVEAK